MDFDADALRQLLGDAAREPASETDFAVVDALLEQPFPPALRALLAVTNGVTFGDVELYDTDALIEHNGDSDHRWLLPASAVEIGTAGKDRALLMTAGFGDEVLEIDSTSWDVGGIAGSADSPAQLLLRFGGSAIAARGDWWAVPGLAEAVERARASLAGDFATLAARGIGARWGSPLPAELGFSAVSMDEALALLGDEGAANDRLNYRPQPQLELGRAGQAQWDEACNALVDAPEGNVQNLLATWPVADVVPDLALVDTTLRQAARNEAYEALVSRAQESMAAELDGRAVHDLPGHRAAAVVLAGHLPVGAHSAI